MQCNSEPSGGAPEDPASSKALNSVTIMGFIRNLGLLSCSRIAPESLMQLVCLARTLGTYNTSQVSLMSLRGEPVLQYENH